MKRSRLFERWRRFQPDWVTLLLVLNVAVYGLTLLLSRFYGSAQSPFDPSSEALFLMGAAKPAFVLDGEVYRLLSCTFLHVSLIHIGVNMLAIYNVGPACQQILGRHSFLSLYILSGLAGSLASCGSGLVSHLRDNSTALSFYLHPGSAGASGALFGLIGFLAVVAKKVPGIGLDKNRIFFIIVLNLALGFSVDYIDNAGHIGGLIGGWLFGLYWIRNPQPGTERFILGSKASLICAALYALTILTVGYAILGPKGAERRELIDLRPQIMIAVDDSAKLRDLKETLAELDENEEAFSHVDTGPLRNYLQFRIKYADRRFTPYDLPAEMVESYGAWNSFLEDLVRTLGNSSGLKVNRR